MGSRPIAKAGLTAALALAAVATDAAAGAEPPPDSLDGIWAGTVGDEPIRACFEGTMGSFYRIGDKRSVWLWADGPDAFAETDDRNPANPRWRLAPAGAGERTGARVQGQSRVPIRLHRVPFTPRPESEEIGPETPCRSLAFVSGRLEPLVVTEEAVETEGVAMVRIVARPPHNGDSFEYRTFRLIGTQPGLAAVNARLEALIDRRGPGESAWSQCMISAGNGGGDFHEALAPSRIGRRFLAATLHRDDSCGGNHPNSGTYPRVFDLETGTEIRMRDWLAPGALDRETLALIGELDESHEPNVMPLSAGLRRLVMRHAAREEGDCEGSIADTAFWSVGVGRHGLLFSPQMAHVARACGQDIEVPFAPLAPFLSNAGRRAVEILRTDRAVFVP